MSLFTLALVAPQGGGSSVMPMLLMWGLIILIFYFILIRPQRQAQKRHQEMLEGLNKGDQVLTDGGIIGEIIHIKDGRLTIRTGENTRIVVARSKIARKLTAEGDEAESE
ncbi:MAG: preprotein translocase subunit YajC [Gemmatimonadota bacterium]